MQPIALVLAETFEQARYAARLVRAAYTEEKSVTCVEDVLDKAYDPPRSAPKPRGNPAAVLATAPVKIEAVYTIPIEHHNPMEPHGAIAFWENGNLKIFDKTQGVNVVREHLAAAFSLPSENVSVTSPFKTAKIEEVEMLDGKLQIKDDSSRSINISELMRRNNLSELVDIHEAKPSPEREKYATGAHGAQFVEVKVDPDVGTIHVTRAIEVSACGKIMNPKTSHSQEIGGVVWGIGMALQEATEIDHRYGRIMNPNLQHYHVPVNADILEIETIFVEEDDKIVNPLGVKGMGELGMVGIPAAIANAVFHATGKRIRELPITPDKLL